MKIMSKEIFSTFEDEGSVAEIDVEIFQESRCVSCKQALRFLVIIYCFEHRHII